MATEFISNSWLMPTNANAEANRVSNYSLDFDSASSQQISLASAFVASGEFTLSLWVNPDDLVNNNFLGNGGAGSNWLQIKTASQIKIRIASSAAIAFTESGGNNLTASAWNHILIYRDSSNNVGAYVNGQTFGSTGSNTSTLTLSTIGRATSIYFDGKITEVSFFDYGLSASQVTQLYGTGSAIGNPMAITNGRKPVYYAPLGNAAFNGEFLVPNGAEKDFVFDFDGSSTKITFSEITFSTASTLSAWAKRNTTGNMFLFGNTNSGGYGCYFVGTSGVYVQGSGGYFAFTNSDVITAMSRTDWVNWLFIKDSSTNLLSVYVDGVLAQSTTSAAGMDSLTSIGGSGLPTGNQFIWDGLVSNVSLFNTALPATGTESVESLYNYGTPPNIASYSNLQGWWELDASATFDGSNWNIPDASSNSNTGTSSGMTSANLVQSDLIINAPYDSFSLQMDGANDYIETSGPNITSGGFSFSGWFKTSDTTNNQVIWNGIDSTTAKSFLRITGTALRLKIIDGSGGNNNIDNTVTTADGNWHHIAFTTDGLTTTDGVVLYIDGEALAVKGTLSNAGFASTTKNQIGSYAPNTWNFNGSLSNISIYSSELTSAQVKTLYNEAKPFDLNTFAVTPVAWWRLGATNSSFDGTNWTVLDEISTSGNNGVSANMTQSDLVDGVGATGSGTSSGMSSGTNKTGDAPYSTSNAVSYNMSVTAKSTSVPT